MTPESNQKRPKRSWSRGEKLLIIVPVLIAALALGGFFWNRATNTLPPAEPPHPMPAINARDYYIAATNALVENNKIEYANALWTIRTKTADPKHPFYSLVVKEKLVDENASALRLLYLGFQYPYQQPPVLSFYVPDQLLQNIQPLAQLLSLKGQVKAAHKDWSGAVDADLDAVQIGETLPRGGGLDAMLTGEQCQFIGRGHIWSTVPHLSASDAQTARRRLEAIRKFHVPYAQVLLEEKAATQVSLCNFMKKPDWINQINAGINLSAPTLLHDPQEWAKEIEATSYVRLIGKSGVLRNHAQWMDKMITQDHLPYAAHLVPPPIPKDIVNQSLLQGYSKSRFYEVNTDTQNALLVTTLALQAYHQDYKAYPTTLDALMPGYLKAMPTDPFALSGPLQYKPTGTKYRLYSVGPDGKDDSGKPIFASTLSVPTSIKMDDGRLWVESSSRGDVVAGVNTR